MNHSGLSRSRDERGATAILFALLALVLLGVGAVAIDMGQVYAKRSSLQSGVDQAVLAAAAELDGTNTCTTKARAAAKHYLESNWIDNSNDPIPVDLTLQGTDPRFDPSGFIKCTGWEVELWAPKAHVDFGLAKALDGSNEGVDVPAYAKAGVFSPATGVMPAFAVAGCDYGPETLLDPPGGHESVYVPTLTESTPPYADSSLAGLSPEVIALNQFTSLTISGPNGGHRFAGINAVAFTTEDGGHVEILDTAIAPAPHITVSENTVVISEVPAAVRDVERVWWVRVSKDAGMRWTDPAEAQPLRVGAPQLECAGSGNEGNFGTVDLPHLSPSANAEKAIEWNMATNVSFGLTTLLGTSGSCNPGTGGAVSPTADGTNCVKSKPGFAGNPATNGLISGPSSSQPGRLAAKSTTSGCAPDGGSGDFHTPKIGGSYYDINDDTLSCFFTNGTTSVDDVSLNGGSYPGPEVVSADVFESPRFVWVPVFALQPDAGGSNWYSIVDFRPGFITGELGGSRRDAKVMDPATENGLAFASSGIETLKVVFFDADALPASMAGGPVMTYLGVGTKVIVLRD